MKRRISRRAAIATTVAAGAFVPLTSLTGQTPRGLNAAQRKLLEASVDRLIPADELGPGALQAGAAEYIDRCLAGFLAAEKQALTGGLAAMDEFARASEGAGFLELDVEKREAVMLALENNIATGFPNGRNFFNRLRRLTLEGMFGDPHWGGNRSFAGWDLIRYPGPRLAVGAENQKLGVEIAPYRKSAWGGDHNGH